MKKKSNLTFLMTLLLAITFIASNYLVISMKILRYSTYISMFIYPLAFLFSNIINKQYGHKAALKSFLCAFAVQLIVFIVDISFFKHLTSSFVIAEIIALIVPHTINIFSYKYLADKKKLNFFSVFILMCLMMVIDNIVFYAATTFIAGYTFELVPAIASTVIKCLYCILLAFVDTRVQAQKNT